MSVLTTLGVFNYGLVLLYGLFLSTFISGGWENTKQRTLVFAACPLFLMIQSVCWLALGADMARQLYPDARIEITGFEKTNRKDFEDIFNSAVHIVFPCISEIIGPNARKSVKSTRFP